MFSPQLRKLALREARILQSLQHPNVVKLHELFRTRSKLFMVFEYVDKSILNVLEAQPRGLPLIDTKAIIWQLLQALQFLHEQQVGSQAPAYLNLEVNPEGCLFFRSPPGYILE